MIVQIRGSPTKAFVIALTGVAAMTMLNLAYRGSVGSVLEGFVSNDIAMYLPFRPALSPPLLSFFLWQSSPTGRGWGGWRQDMWLSVRQAEV